jgi:prepilin-type processing-associated H-X9-DG protein
MSCQNNLKQISLGLHNYESTHKRFPPLALLSRTEESESLSAYARLLAYLEQSRLASMVDYSVSAELQPTIANSRISIMLCPNDPGSEPDVGLLTGVDSPVSYAFSSGTWFQFDPTSGKSSDGAFAVNKMMLPSAFTDGMTHTVGVSEVRSYQDIWLDAQRPDKNNSGPPLSTEDLLSLGGMLAISEGHRQWMDGALHQTAFTHTFVPNTSQTATHAPSGSDWLNIVPGTSTDQPSYAAITSRSYHVGGINAAFMDGSVHFLHDSVDLKVWRAYGTRSGEELTGELEAKR